MISHHSNRYSITEPAEWSAYCFGFNSSSIFINWCLLLYMSIYIWKYMIQIINYLKHFRFLSGIMQVDQCLYSNLQTANILARSLLVLLLTFKTMHIKDSDFLIAPCFQSQSDLRNNLRKFIPHTQAIYCFYILPSISHNDAFISLTCRFMSPRKFLPWQINMGFVW